MNCSKCNNGFLQPAKTWHGFYYMKCTCCGETFDAEGKSTELPSYSLQMVTNTTINNEQENNAHEKDNN